MIRPMAALVVLALLSPTFSGVACDLACAIAAEHAERPMAGMACHQRQPVSQGPQLRSIAAGPCQVLTDAMAAVAYDSLRWIAAPAPAGVQLTPVVSESRAPLHRLPASSSPSPPLTAPLRI